MINVQPASARTDIIFSVELTFCDFPNFCASNSEAICGTFSSADLGILAGGAKGGTNPVLDFTAGRLREAVGLFWRRTIFCFLSFPARVSELKILLEASDNGGKGAKFCEKF